MRRFSTLVCTAVIAMTVFALPAGAMTFDCTNQTSMSETECQALVSLYNSTNGPSWTHATNWLVANDPCDWNEQPGQNIGVICSGGSPSQLRLPSNNLVGTLPTEFGDLPDFATIVIAGNNGLTGSIPTTVGNLTSVRTLQLHSNNLSGSIPTSITSAIQLRSLRLDRNQLSGSIPTATGSLSQLRVFKLGYNQLSGSIPTGLGTLSNLEQLDLENNQLTGSIPTSLGNLSNLSLLWLQLNDLSGSIPSQFGNLTNLTSLGLGNNDLTGSIPVELGNMTNIEVLAINNTQLSGAIPAELGNLSNLTYLQLGGNSLTGSIPSSLGNATALSTLVLDFNQLSGPIPASIGSLTNLTFLRLGNNALTGQIPSTFGALTQLGILSLANTQLSGTVPSSLTNLTSLPLIASRVPSQTGLYLESTGCLNADASTAAWLDARTGWETNCNSPDTTPPSVDVVAPVGAVPGVVSLSGTASDNVAIDRLKLYVRNLGTGEYWNGSAWVVGWSWFDPGGTTAFSYDITLPAGSFQTIAWAWDTSNNIAPYDFESFSVTGPPDNVAPVVDVVGPVGAVPGVVSITGTASDDVAVDRLKLYVRNTSTGEYWNGAGWVAGWSWFDPGGTTSFSYDITLPAGEFQVIAWAWDTANNVSPYDVETFVVGVSDNTAPVVDVVGPVGAVPGVVSITGTASDDVAVDRLKLYVRNKSTGEYWNGAGWVAGWSWFDPGGTTSFSYDITLPAGEFQVIAWAWDTANNVSPYDFENFSVS